MKTNLNTAPLFLLVEASPVENAEELFSALAERYDPRRDASEWGPLYQIGPRYECGGRIFFQVQTLAGSLGSRMMLDIGNKEFDRAILFNLSGEGNAGFELIAPDGTARHFHGSELTKT